LVTGASAGIGLVFAERLAREGHDLVLVARRRDRLEALAERLRGEAGIEAEVVCADLTDAKAVAEIETRIANDEALTLLVNNAGFGGYQPFTSIDPKVIDDLVAIHIGTVARLTRAALPGMVGRGRGAIINIASLLALSGTLPPSPLPHRATYAGAKAFMLTFTQALAGELTGTEVRVQVCLPGRVATEFHSIQGIDTSKLPPAMFAEDVVAASLSALARSYVFRRLPIQLCLTGSPRRR
jgi:short-subunit dehydrogenase